MQQKWWLFNATDFQTLMRPCVLFCGIFGVFPYKINNSIIKTSIPHYILSIIIFCALCVLELTYEFDNVTQTNFVAITRSLERTYVYTLIDFLSIITLVLKSSRMRLLQTIMEISLRLSPESYRKLSRFIHAKDIISFLYLSSMFSIYFYKKPMDTLYMIFIMYLILMILQLHMLYTNCVCVIKACFKEINNNLLHMQKLIVNNESHVHTMFHYEQKNLFLIMKLKALKKRHMMISYTVQMLNMTFNLQLPAMILVIFLDTIHKLYLFILQWDDRLVINLKEVWQLFGLILLFIKIVLAVWACETGKNEAREIRTTIHGVLNSTKDKRIKDELQLFSLQVLHCKNTFSAKVFGIDVKFLATMVGTITTYILIMLQFLIMSQSCDRKSALNIT